LSINFFACNRFFSYNEKSFIRQKVKESQKVKYVFTNPINRLNNELLKNIKITNYVPNPITDNDFLNCKDKILEILKTRFPDTPIRLENNGDILVDWN
jgi:hypothetical protein